MAKIFPSSQNPEETALRVKSLLILLVPLLLNLLNGISGQTIAPDVVLSFVDASFVVLFGVMQFIGWIRSIKTDNLPTYPDSNIIE